VATDGENLLVSCARGVQTRNPNGKPVAVAQADFPNRAQYIVNIIDGTVSRISLASALKDLPRLSEQVLENNALRPQWRPSANGADGAEEPGHRARDLCHQGEPDVRPGSRRHRARQR
jgi:hypothetical protein